jgi:hypothetical protein
MAFLETLIDIVNNTNKLLFIGVMAPFSNLFLSIIIYKRYKKSNNQILKKLNKYFIDAFKLTVFSLLIPSIVIKIFGFGIFETYWIIPIIVPYTILSFYFDKKIDKILKIELNRNKDNY